MSTSTTTTVRLVPGRTIHEVLSYLVAGLPAETRRFWFRDLDQDLPETIVYRGREFEVLHAQRWRCFVALDARLVDRSPDW